MRLVVFSSIALTLFHFADNTIYIDTYPKAGWQPDWFSAVVVVAWFAYTAVGIVAVRLYQAGRLRSGRPLLLIYGYLVISSLGHFFYGSPADLTTRALVSVLIDTVAGSAVIGVALWSIVTRGRTAAP